jgi:hypothetical protein
VTLKALKGFLPASAPPDNTQRRAIMHTTRHRAALIWISLCSTCRFEGQLCEASGVSGTLAAAFPKELRYADGPVASSATGSEARVLYDFANKARTQRATPSSTASIGAP